MANYQNQQELQMYFKELNHIPVMTPKRERELSLMMRDGNTTQIQKDKIIKELLEGNLRFVIKIANKYQNQGMDLVDLISEGNLGLMKAIEDFNWEKELRFITYAVWWIKQSILEALNENRTIRLPMNILQDISNAKKLARETNTEIDGKFTSYARTISADNWMNDEGDTFFNILENKDTPLPDEGIDGNPLKYKLRNALLVLNEKEKTIIEKYFGLNSMPQSFETLSEEFNLTKERIRQIKEKALQKLRTRNLILN
jgi:RNA polymerase primary sigma factor